MKKHGKLRWLQTSLIVTLAVLILFLVVSPQTVMQFVVLSSGWNPVGSFAVKLFVTSGADIDYVYCDSETGICQTLLEQHVDQRNIDIASMLLRNGANPDCTHSGDGNTLLMSTVFGNDREMSFLLCEFGADIEATNAEGKDVKYHAKKNPGLYLELKNRFSR